MSPPKEAPDFNHGEAASKKNPIIDEKIAELEKKRKRLYPEYEDIGLGGDGLEYLTAQIDILRELKPEWDKMEDDLSTLAECYGDGGEWLMRLKKDGERLQKERNDAVTEAGFWKAKCGEWIDAFEKVKAKGKRL